MNRIAFRQLLQKYASGTASQEEKELVDHWYELIYNTDNIAALKDAELSVVEEEMWNRIEQDMQWSEGQSHARKIPKRQIIFRWVAAAAILIAVAFGLNRYLFVDQRNKDNNKLTESINSNPEIKKIVLEDGTTITLQPSAKLTYPGHFAGDKREVYLEGEAFFDVVKNPAKPFLVHSGNLITQVLGTSFTIKPNRKFNTIMVEVKTGKVAVYENNNSGKLNASQPKNQGAIITPNQKAVYDIANRNFNISIVENPEPLAEAHNPSHFVFDDTNLATVLENISKGYAIDIMVENENIYHCKFSGDITNQGLYNKLDLICQSTGLQYELLGTKILIKGKGCQ